jgi:hypothetical protein
MINQARSLEPVDADERASQQHKAKNRQGGQFDPQWGA